MQPAQSMTDVRLRALADPVRRDILKMVARTETPSGRIAGAFQISRPAISRHLKVLRDADLITVREEGTSRYYLADRAALVEIAAWFDGFWDEGLPRLKALAEKESRGDA